ncbi:hypothetical protein J6590_098228, partial [Homalodisca vitripennis]
SVLAAQLTHESIILQDQPDYLDVYRGHSRSVKLPPTGHREDSVCALICGRGCHGRHNQRHVYLCRCNNILTLATLGNRTDSVHIVV